MILHSLKSYKHKAVKFRHNISKSNSVTGYVFRLINYNVDSNFHMNDDFRKMLKNSIFFLNHWSLEPLHTSRGRVSSITVFKSRGYYENCENQLSIINELSSINYTGLDGVLFRWLKFRDSYIRSAGY